MVRIPFCKPAKIAIPTKKLSEINDMDAPQLTNGRNCRRLEEWFCNYYGVKNCVAVSSCTSGLMLCMRALVQCGQLVAMPSFTFMATAHAAYWNNNSIRWLDVDNDSFCVEQSQLDELQKSSVYPNAIVLVHQFGNPCRIDKKSIGDTTLVYDAAHGVGCRDLPIGDAAVFSLSPTKLATGGEGGIIATNSDSLAIELRSLLDYGKSRGYSCDMVGLNARQSEYNACYALESLVRLDEEIEKRAEIAAKYTAGLPRWATPQKSHSGRVWKDFTVRIDGIDRDTVRRELELDGIETRTYYDPPCHRMPAYRSTTLFTDRRPTTTEALSKSVISLPIYSSLTDFEINYILDCLHDCGVKQHVA